MENQPKLRDFEVEIRENKDTQGILPQDCIGGEIFTISCDTEGYVYRVKNKQGKHGEFPQFTLNLEDAMGNKRTLSYLMESNLSPLRRAFGHTPAQWYGKNIIVKGFVKPNGFYDVKLEVAQ